MWVILSARPCCVTAATESPPPTTTVAPGLGRARRGTARSALVPWANDGISNTPSGPFQKTVWTSASASTIRSWLALPRSTMCHAAGIFSAGSVLYSVPRVTSLATMTSTGRTTRTPFFSAVARIAPGVVDPVGLGQALADRLALGEQERVGHAAAEDEHVDLGQQVVEDLDLVARPWRRRGSPRTAARGSRAACESISISRSISSPA